jgi:hypothetical protein
MRSKISILVGFCHRCAYGVVLSLLVWVFTLHLPLPEGPTARAVTTVTMKALDLPVALATQLMPCDEFAIDIWFSVRGGGGCPQPLGNLLGYFWNHMRVAVPTYVLIFYIPAGLAVVYRRILRRRRAL